MTDLLAALLGPVGGLLAGGLGIIAALFWGRSQGRKRERQRQSNQRARDYRDERRKIDEKDLGIGSTDADRIDRLREIAGRRGSKRQD